MKNFFKIAGIVLALGISFLSCSENNNEAVKSKTTSPQKNTNSTLATVCDITGSTVTTSGSAIVNPNSTTTYTYTYASNTPSPMTINWSVQSANPAGSITITGTGTTVTVSYSASFISGSISAFGSGGGSATCQSILNITKAAPNCCAHTTSLSYICRGSGVTSLSGFVKIRNPNNCNNWSNISKIDFDITAGVVFSQTNPSNGLNGLSVGTIYPPFNTTLINGNGVYELSVPFKKLDGCLPEITCITKIYYNNGCPPTVTEAAGYYDF